MEGTYVVDGRLGKEGKPLVGGWLTREARGELG